LKISPLNVIHESNELNLSLKLGSITVTL